MTTIQDNLAWMYWTTPTALATGALLITLIAMTLWDYKSPSTPRKGFLPLPTTRGDRLFIAIISTIGLHLLWLGILGNTLLWIPLTIAVIWCAAVALKG